MLLSVVLARDLRSPRSWGGTTELEPDALASDLQTASSAGAADESAPTPLQLKDWIADLADGRLRTREAATRQLLAGGKASVEALLECASTTDDNEAAQRCMQLLKTMSLAQDTALTARADAALHQLLAHPDVEVKRRAQLTLDLIRRAHSNRALLAIRRSGGTVFDNYGTGNDNPTLVLLGQAWRGGEEGFRQLRWLDGLENLGVENRLFSDQHLVYLEELTSLRSVYLYGTQVSAMGEALLKKKRPDLLIDRRDGAFLGVAGSTDPRGCMVEFVQAGAAAEAAGLRVGDVITNCAGKAISGFDSLTGVLARKRPGQKVVLQVLRGNREITLEAVLGVFHLLYRA